jgi:hypothetical protein
MEIWFLGTDDIDKVKKSFYKYSKLILKFLSNDYDFVENYVPKDHIKTIKWLQWIGFKIENQQYFVDEYEFVRVFYCNSTQIKCNSKLSERPVLH